MKHFEAALKMIKPSYVKQEQEKWQDIEKKMSEIVR